MAQIVMSERAYDFARERYPDASMVNLQLKGKAEPMAARAAIELKTPVAA